MLQKLTVRNFAIIDESEIVFSKGLHTITGETGAGKSILLGALSLILGQRADKSAILNPANKSIIEGHFLLSKQAFQDFFITNDLDFDEQTIIRRELKADGKSRAFINDTPVTLDLLKELTSQLVDLHQQHESLSLATADFQRQVLDVFAATNTVVENYNQLYTTWKQETQLLNRNRELEAKNKQEQDFLSFQRQELEAANLRVGELNELEQELQTANHFEQIQESLAKIEQLFQDDEHGAILLLKQAVAELRKLTLVRTDFTALEQRLHSNILELEDIEQELLHTFSDEEAEPEHVLQVEQRVNLINKLLNKHQVQSEQELLQLKEDFTSRINSFASVTSKISQLEVSVKEQEKELQVLANTITTQRKQAIPQLEQEIQNLFSRVGMPKAQLQVELNSSENLLAYGQEQVQFLFSANQGLQPQPLKQVASGGELSRLLLALKSLVAGKTILPTMIFDEIDTGISGEVAIKVGNLLQELAENHQIIAITHLPQIAAKGTQQYKVFKEDESGSTRSKVIRLTAPERVTEIAEMLSGANPSKSSLQAAKELLGNDD